MRSSNFVDFAKNFVLTGGTHGHHPRTVDGLTVRPVGQVTDRSSCPWIDAPKAQLRSRLMVDQYGPSIDPRSVGLTVVPLVPDQEVSNAEFWNANSVFGSGSQVGEDPQNFIDEVKKIFGVMQVTNNGRVELASYQVKDMAHIWYTQRKDSGATLSFMSPFIAVQFSVSPETLSEPFLVSTPIGDPVLARRVYKNCPVTVSQKVTSVDRVELEMVDFDIILGMDWIQFCHALVDCRIRVVQFQFPNEPVLE
ncbi:hypothetical protein MTR67_031377 [Solanum verrucosum]|uniref:Gag-pol polyprotein n=1 Tax=Solanum verrucosum TaxID=315347 RepID=A0AAF0U2F1_SOLVR|nr:hypothetical protein MTR67_031377 [Solanum verrucosum]